MNFYRRNLILINSLFTLLVLGVLTYTALAHSSGMTGRTEVGCTCHSLNPSSNVKVTLSSGSGSFTFEPNSTTTFTVMVENASKSKAGVNVGVKTAETSGSNVGTLAAGNGTKIQGGEVTHNGAQTLSGGKFSFTFDWTAPATHGEYWIRGVSNTVDGNRDTTNDEWNRFTTQKIVVAGVTVSAPNGGENWCAGSKQDIKWTSDAVSNVKIEFSTDGGANWNTIVASTPAAAGTYAWSIPSDFIPGGLNKIRVSDVAKSTRNDASDGTFTVNGEATITAQPVDVNTCTGESFTFTVSVSGAGHQYQWRKNGSNIAGAKSSSFSRTKAVKGDAGSYDCVISTTCGDELTSEVATLTLSTSPSFTTQPESKSVCDGNSVTLSAVTDGEVTSMQWYKDNKKITGETQAELTIDDATAEDAGNYKLELTSACNAKIFSNVVSITINGAPIITMQPVAQEVFVGDTITLSVVADNPGGATDELTYQWKKDGADIPGATDSVYTIENVGLGNAGKYKVAVKNSCPLLGIISAEAEVKVLEKKTGPAITLNITSLDFENVALGETSSKSFAEVITNSGDEPLTITSMALLGDDASAFELIAPSLPVTVEPSMSVGIELKFTPNKTGLHKAKINFESNATNSVEIPVQGSGVDNGTIVSSTSLLDFGDALEVGESVSLTLELSNPTTKDIKINEISTSASVFVAEDLAGVVLSPSGTSELTVTFTPAEAKVYEESLTIKTDDGKTLVIVLKGKAIISSVWEGIPSITETKAYPNPSEHSIAISLVFDLVQEYSINIVDLKGNIVKTMGGYSTIGTNIIEWNNNDNSGNNVAKGVYYAIIQVGDNIQTIPLVVR